MSRIQDAFKRAKNENRLAFIAYICGGDGGMARTVDLLLACQRSGVDIVELGVPFSDPTADGPTIARAAERALEGGASFSGVVGALRDARQQGFELPVVLFGYYNPILAHGEQAAIEEAKAAGVDAMLTVDLPIDEAGAFVSMLRDASMSFVPLVAPTTPVERARKAAALADDFVYYVSMTGVTGMSGTDLAHAARRAAALERTCARTVALGFGIKSAADLETIRGAEGGPPRAIVVGSAIVARAHDAGVEAAAELMNELAEATVFGVSNAKNAP